MGLSQTAHKNETEPEELDDEDDLKHVIKILNDQVMKKSIELTSLKKKHEKEKTDIEI